MTQPENIRTHYRELLLRIRRVRNICSRVKNSTGEANIRKDYLRASERRILEKEVPILGQQFTQMLASGDKLGFIMFTMVAQFGLDMEGFDDTRDEHGFRVETWLRLRLKAHELYGKKIVDPAVFAEYVAELWEMLELSPTQFSSRLMLFKLKLN